MLKMVLKNPLLLYAAYFGWAMRLFISVVHGDRAPQVFDLLALNSRGNPDIVGFTEEFGFSSLLGFLFSSFGIALLPVVVGVVAVCAAVT